MPGPSALPPSAPVPTPEAAARQLRELLAGPGARAAVEAYDALERASHRTEAGRTRDEAEGWRVALHQVLRQGLAREILAPSAWAGLVFPQPACVPRLLAQVHLRTVAELQAYLEHPLPGVRQWLLRRHGGPAIPRRHPLDGPPLDALDAGWRREWLARETVGEVAAEALCWAPRDMVGVDAALATLTAMPPVALQCQDGLYGWRYDPPAAPPPWSAGPWPVMPGTRARVTRTALFRSLTERFDLQLDEMAALVRHGGPGVWAMYGEVWAETDVDVTPDGSPPRPGVALLGLDLAWSHPEATLDVRLRLLRALALDASAPAPDGSGRAAARRPGRSPPRAARSRRTQGRADARKGGRMVPVPSRR